MRRDGRTCLVRFEGKAHGARGETLLFSPCAPLSTRARSDGPRHAEHILGLAALVSPGLPAIRLTARCHSAGGNVPLRNYAPRSLARRGGGSRARSATADQLPAGATRPLRAHELTLLAPCVRERTWLVALSVAMLFATAKASRLFRKNALIRVFRKTAAQKSAFFANPYGEQSLFVAAFC